MPERSSIILEYDDLDLTDRDLFSLYLRYPDMQASDQSSHGEEDAESPLAPLTNSSPDSSPQSTQIYSSPLPHPIRYESPTSSPLGPPDIVPFPALIIAANEPEVDELTAQFDLGLRSHELSEETGEFLLEAKSNIVVMGSILFSSTGGISDAPENIWRVRSTARWLTLSFKCACHVIGKEIRAAESILQFAPFTVRPASEDLWTNYKQMAELIIE